MFDLVLMDCTLPDGRINQSIAIKNGHIVRIQERIEMAATRYIDCGGQLITTPFIDAHLHMDSVLTQGIRKINKSGTLLEGIDIWNDLAPTITQDEIVGRALKYCNWAIANGLLAIRTHVDISDDKLLALEALIHVRALVKPYLTLQLVAFPQNGYLRSKNSYNNMVMAIKLGVDVIGGIPHFERTYVDGSESIRQLCELAAEKGVLLDLHCDETDDPMSRHIETYAYHVHRLGLEGRAAASHLTSMHSMDNNYASKLISLIHESGVSVIANPFINITLQGRYDTYPKRRGLTRIKELVSAGIPVAMGQDCVMDPWYSLGNADMLDVAHMGIHAAQMTSPDEMYSCYQSITEIPAKILQLPRYGLEEGSNADLVLLQARDPIEAIRVRATRLIVIKSGEIISESPKSQSTLHLNNAITEISAGYL